MSGNRLTVSADVLANTMTPDQKGSELVGDAYEIGPDRIATTVMDSVPTMDVEGPRAGTLGPQDAKRIAFLYNKMLKAGQEGNLAPGHTKQGLRLSQQVQSKAQNISGGKPLNTSAPKITAPMLNQILLMFGMLEKNAVLHNIPSLRKADLAVYYRLTGGRRLPSLFNKRRRFGRYVALSNALTTSGPTFKRPRTVILSGAQADVVERNTAPVAPALSTDEKARKCVLLDMPLDMPAPRYGRRGRFGPEVNQYRSLKNPEAPILAAALEAQKNPQKKVDKTPHTKPVRSNLSLMPRVKDPRLGLTG